MPQIVLGLALLASLASFAKAEPVLDCTGHNDLAFKVIFDTVEDQNNFAFKMYIEQRIYTVTSSIPSNKDSEVFIPPFGESRLLIAKSQNGQEASLTFFGSNNSKMLGFLAENGIVKTLLCE